MTSAGRPDVSFARGAGFGLNARVALVEGNLPAVSDDRLAQVKNALERRLHVPDGFWETLEVPHDPTAYACSLAYLAISAHLRQIVCWRATRLSGEGQNTLILPYQNAALARDLVNRVLEWLTAERIDDDKTLDALLEAVNSAHRRHLTTFVTKSALGFTALRLGYPLFEDEFSNLVVGEGMRARVLNGLHTDQTSVLGVFLSSNKSHTARRLRRAGLPAAPNLAATTVEDAMKAATRIGFPVVVKPADQEHGNGVTNDVRDEAELRRAWLGARKYSEAILVEQHVAGFTHRVTVMAGEVVNVVRRMPGGVTGDGRSTVAELVDQFNAAPRQARLNQRRGNAALTLDREAAELLRRAGLSDKSVVAEGAFVALRRKDNSRAGGTNHPVRMEDAHPDNLTLAVQAAQVMLLDIAGVDLILSDIGTSWRAQQSTICEVNSNPEMGLTAHGAPFEAALAQLTGGSADHARIPVTLHVMADTDWQPGERPEAAQAAWYCDAAGLLQGERFVAGPFDDGFHAARAALANRSVTALDTAIAASQLLQAGLPSARFDRILLDARLASRQSAAIRALCAGHGPIEVRQPG